MSIVETEDTWGINFEQVAASPMAVVGDHLVACFQATAHTKNAILDQAIIGYFLLPKEDLSGQDAVIAAIQRRSKQISQHIQSSGGNSLVRTMEIVNEDRPESPRYILPLGYKGDAFATLGQLEQFEVKLDRNAIVPNHYRVGVFALQGDMVLFSDLMGDTSPVDEQGDPTINLNDHHPDGAQAMQLTVDRATATWESPGDPIQLQLQGNLSGLPADASARVGFLLVRSGKSVTPTAVAEDYLLQKGEKGYEARSLPEDQLKALDSREKNSEVIAIETNSNQAADGTIETSEDSQQLLAKGVSYQVWSYAIRDVQGVPQIAFSKESQELHTPATEVVLVMKTAKIDYVIYEAQEQTNGSWQGQVYTMVGSLQGDEVKLLHADGQHKVGFLLVESAGDAGEPMRKQAIKQAVDNNQPWSKQVSCFVGTAGDAVVRGGQVIEHIASGYNHARNFEDLRTDTPYDVYYWMVVGSQVFISENCISLTIPSPTINGNFVFGTRVAQPNGDVAKEITEIPQVGNGGLVHHADCLQKESFNEDYTGILHTMKTLRDSDDHEEIKSARDHSPNLSYMLNKRPSSIDLAYTGQAGKTYHYSYCGLQGNALYIFKEVTSIESADKSASSIPAVSIPTDSYDKQITKQVSHFVTSSGNVEGVIVVYSKEEDNQQKYIWDPELVLHYYLCQHISSNDPQAIVNDYGAWLAKRTEVLNAYQAADAAAKRALDEAFKLGDTHSSVRIGELEELPRKWKAENVDSIFSSITPEDIDRNFRTAVVTAICSIADSQ